MLTTTVTRIISLTAGANVVRVEWVEGGGFAVESAAIETIDNAGDATFTHAGAVTGDAFISSQVGSMALPMVGAITSNAVVGQVGALALPMVCSVTADAAVADAGAIHLPSTHLVISDAVFVGPGAVDGSLTIEATLAMTADAIEGESGNLVIAATHGLWVDGVWAPREGIHRLPRNPRAGLSWVAGPRSIEPRIVIWFADAGVAAILTIEGDAVAAEQANFGLAATLETVSDATASEIAEVLLEARLGVDSDANVIEATTSVLNASHGFFSDAVFLEGAYDWVTLQAILNVAFDAVFTNSVPSFVNLFATAIPVGLSAIANPFTTSPIVYGLLAKRW